MVQYITHTNAEIELGYWGIRGLGQPIRFLLTFVDQPFNEVRLGVHENGELIVDRALENQDWVDHKLGIDMPFPNLPYLVDKSNIPEVRLTQSNAIMRYLGRKYDLYGDNEMERTLIDQLQDEAFDYRNCIIDAVYVDQQDFPKTLATFVSTAIPRYLDRFEKYLSDSGSASNFVGKRISFVDFILYELIWQSGLMVPDTVTKLNYPALFSFIASFSSMPLIASYITSEAYIEHPINSPWTPFN